MANFILGNLQERFESTATSAGTKTLTKDSPKHQIFTGTSTHNLKLPDATTMVNGLSFVIINESTGAITVQYNDNTTLVTVSASQSVQVFLTNNGTSNGTWSLIEGAGGGGGITVTDWTSYTPTFTGMGTVTSISMWYKQIDNLLLLQGKFTSGLASATEARMSLPSGYTSSTLLPTLSLAGEVAHASTTGEKLHHVLIEANVTYVTFGAADGSAGSLSKRNGNAYGNANEPRSLYAIIQLD